jgi:hypothetical protein
MKKILLFLVIASVILSSCTASKTIKIGGYEYYGGNRHNIEKRKAIKAENALRMEFAGKN